MLSHVRLDPCTFSLCCVRTLGGCSYIFYMKMIKRDGTMMATMIHHDGASASGKVAAVEANAATNNDVEATAKI